MSASSGIDRLLAAHSEHRLLDSLVDHGDTISLRHLPSVLRYLDELRAVINAEPVPRRPGTPDTSASEPMVFQMEISPRRAQPEQQESASRSAGARSSPEPQSALQLVTREGESLSEEKQWYLYTIVDEVKRALPRLVDMYECKTSMIEADDISDDVRLRTSDGYIIALTDTLVTAPLRARDADSVEVYELPEGHIMRVLDEDVYIAGWTDVALVFPKVS